MAKLKPTDRELLLLLTWQEMSISEISEVLGITKANVSVRLKRARARLAKILQDTAEEGH
jgi:RNA polymerase sigma-70 factor (ECF subfamily)